MKKKGVKINLKINLTNRWLYTFIALGILVIIGVGVYALTPGVAPNPGHLVSDVAPPSGCAANQVLQWTGSAWTCVDLPQQQILSGTVMGGYTQYFYWATNTYLNVNINNVLPTLTSIKGVDSWGVAIPGSNGIYSCPTGYTSHPLSGSGYGALFGTYTDTKDHCNGANPPCVITSRSSGCIKN